MTVERHDAALELENIQSEIVRGYGRTETDAGPRHGMYLLLRFDNGGRGPHDARAFLRSVEVTYANDWRAEDTHVNVGFTYRGLTEAFGLPLELLKSRDRIFAELEDTMAARSELLGDLDDSSSENWSWSDAKVRHEREKLPEGEPARFDDIHMVVMIFGHDPEAVRTEANHIELRAKRAGAEVLREEGTELADRREHFGFVDGISQPAIKELGGSPVGQGAVTADGHWRHIAAGELVLGYHDESSPWADAPISRNGSFFVLRKIEQHVREFHEYLEARARDTKQPSEWLASRIMGRTYDGAPIVKKDDAPRPTQAEATPDYHDFVFSQDAIGFECPHGAHIRRANPRDALNRPGDRAERHRIARRSLMYAEAGGKFALEPGSPSLGHRLGKKEPVPRDATPTARGMLFGAFNASIRRQFEIVQGEWLAGGGANPTRLFTLADPLTGAHRGKASYVIPGRPTTVLGQLRRFVTTKAGAYFFVPGREALATISRDESIVAARISRPVLPPAPTSSPGGTRAPAPPRSNPFAAGYSWLKGAITTPRSREPAEPIVGGVPEEQVLVVLAPIVRQERGRVKRELAKHAELDEIFRGIGDSGRTIHHVRFAYVESFKQFPEDPTHDPESLPLPENEHYLFFVCWFDGPRADLMRALLAAQDRLPFRFCASYKQGLEAFVRLYAKSPRFVYRAFPASTEAIRKALELRLAFTTMLQESQSRAGAIDKRKRLLELFEEHRAALKD